MKRPVWLLSMDSDEFNAPPTTTASLTAYFNRYAQSATDTHIDLVHFQCAANIDEWLSAWREEQLPIAIDALEQGLQPVLGFSF